MAELPPLESFEILDWDDPEQNSDPETNNLLHCQRPYRLGADAEMIVYEVLAEEPVEVRFSVQTAEYAVVGPTMSSRTHYLILFRRSHKRGDWLRPVTGWRAERAEIAEWTASRSRRR